MMGRAKQVLYRGSALLLGVLALAALSAAYFSRATSIHRMVLIGLAGVSLLGIDLVIPGVIVEKPRHRRLLPIWCLVPFGLAFFVGAAQHYHIREEALNDTQRLATEVIAALRASDAVPAARGGQSSAKPDPGGAERKPASGAGESISNGEKPSAPVGGAGTSSVATSPLAAPVGPASPEPGSAPATPTTPNGATSKPAAKAPAEPYTTDALMNAVKQLEAARQGTNLGNEEAQRFNALARTVANDLNDRALDAARVRADADSDTFAEFLLALAVQGLFVFWVPCLLAVAIKRASLAVEQVQGCEFTPNGVKRSIRTRDENILGEKRPLFIPRLCFALLMLLGTNYIFAPLGLKTTYMMTIVDQHAAPGQTSFTLWSTSFSQSPVITAGFLGFLLYAVIASTQRFTQDDFDDQAMFSLLVRGLVVILLSFALSASPMNEQISRTFVFVAGVFPVRALEALSKKLSITLDPDFSPNDNGSFEGLPSLDPTKAFALRAAGIQSTADLAAMEINSIAERVRINPRLLGRTVDRAILIDAVGMAIVGKLEDCGVRLATEIAVPEDEIPAPVVETLGDMAKMIAKRLVRDPRVEAVRQWRTSTSDAAAVAEVTQKVEMSSTVKRLIDDGDRAGAANEFITIDLSAFGPLAPLHLLYSAFPQVDQLIEGVCSQLSGSEQIERFQYGKQWELRADPAVPRSVVPHARVDRQLWGVPVPDPTPLGDRGIARGATLYAVPLPDPAPGVTPPPTMPPPTMPPPSMPLATAMQSAPAAPSATTMPTTDSPAPEGH